MDVTVVIPIGPGHETVAQRAVASVQAQTVPTVVVTVRDTDGRGPGWARNEGLRQVTTPWVLFLDADDWLEPHAVDSLLQAAAQHPGMYVYSDWYAGEIHVNAPQTGFAWCGGTWHAVTALLPTAWVRTVDGFNDTLPGGEDTDFYLNLITSRRCGVRLPEPLLHYSADGQRGKTFVNRPDFEQIMLGIRARYANRGQHMACCGQTVAAPDSGDRQNGDVLAVALWGGNRREHGRATGRLYPRTGNGKTAWVDPRDIDAAPHLWRRADDAEDANSAVDNVHDLAAQMMQRVMPRTARYQPQRAPHVPVTAPDVAAIVRMGIEALGD